MRNKKTIEISFNDVELQKIEESWIKNFEKNNYQGLAEKVVHDFVKTEAEKIVSHFQKEMEVEISGDHKLLISDPVDPKFFFISFCGLILGRIRIIISNDRYMHIEFFPDNQLAQFFKNYPNKKEGA